jgi:hypothetical protein
MAAVPTMPRGSYQRNLQNVREESSEYLPRVAGDTGSMSILPIESGAETAKTETITSIGLINSGSFIHIRGQ